MNIIDIIDKKRKKEELTDEEIKNTGKKLTFKHVKGGVLLVDTDFTIK